MAATQQPEPSPIQTVRLFESGHEGMGDSLAVAEHRYNRIHGSIDARWPGQVRMGQQVVKVATNTLDRTPVYAFEWVDTDTVSPAIFYLVGAEYYKLQYGAVGEVGPTFS